MDGNDPQSMASHLEDLGRKAKREFEKLANQIREVLQALPVGTLTSVAEVCQALDRSEQPVSDALGGNPARAEVVRHTLNYLAKSSGELLRVGDSYGWRSPEQTQPDHAPQNWRYFVAFWTAGKPSHTIINSPTEFTTGQHVDAVEEWLRSQVTGNPVVTGYELLSRPTPEGVTVSWESDEIAVISIGDRAIQLNHDEQGTAGMRAALAVLDAVAAEYDIPVTVHGTPGV